MISRAGVIVFLTSGLTSSRRAVDFAEKHRLLSLSIPLLISVLGYCTPQKRIAATVTEYRHNLHTDVIVSQLLFH